MRTLTLGFIFVWLVSAVPAQSETIYTWTDRDGTRRFSNQPPPEGVKMYQAETVSPANTADTPAEKRRAGYDRMVERAAAESRHLEQQRKTAEAAKAAEQQRQAEAHRQNHIEAQRKQLEKKIKAIRKRALSPTYTQGMQEAQIEELRQQIKQLSGQPESDPAQKHEAPHSGYQP